MSSIAIATLGKFAPAGAGVVGGGAPQMPQEEVKPRLLITGVEVKTKKKTKESITLKITDVEVK
ncbi:MAG: hypothetical protein PVG65_04480 [Candidatus Thorarchaeota archaeon]|jgi:hypothetical protein